MGRTLGLVILVCLLLAAAGVQTRVQARDGGADALDDVTLILENGAPPPESMGRLLSPARARPLADAPPPTAQEPEEAVEADGREPSAPLPAQGSTTELLYREMYQTLLAQDLEQFGYGLFPRQDGGDWPVLPGPDYVLGPGDTLKVRIWGSGRDFAFNGEVAPDGGLDLPMLGIVEVGGKTIALAQKELHELAERYAGGVNLRLTPVTLRSMEIFVVGEVGSPGRHLVPAYASVTLALNKAGGVNKSGSLRRIRLFRAEKPAGEVDFYQLLLHGENRADVTLKARDVIFVPRLGPTAAVAGAVSGPGIYELNGERSAAELLQLAGGALPQGYTGRLYLRRFGPDDTFTIKDITSYAALGRTPIADGDMLELTFSEAGRPPVVRLTGHVKRPDVFAWREGLSLSQVLPGPDILLPEAITDYALLYRFNPATTRRSMQTVPLDRVFRGEFDAPLEPWDSINILSRADFAIKEPVRISGAVWRQGEFDYMPGLSLMDLLALAGGLKFGANPARIEISRKNSRADEMVTSHFSVDFEADPHFKLKPYDYVLVPEAKDASTFRTATISGEVRYPGTYQLQRGERLSDLIERAGGFTSEAYYHGAKYTSERARVIQQESIDRLIQELEIRTNQVVTEQMQTAVDQQDADAARSSALGINALIAKLKQVRAEGRVAIKLADLAVFRASEYDFPVEDGDNLHVPKRPSFVSVVGSVYSPSAYLFQQPLSIDDYLEKSGGPTQTADRDYIYVVGADGVVRSKAQDGVSSRAFMNSPLMPGDTVVVPEDLDRVPYMRLFKDLTDIVFKIATTAGVVYAII